MAALITFEGGEGAGKSTQLRWLAEAMQAEGHDIITTREPGGTDAAERIRELLVSGDTQWQSETEALLMMAARAEHVAERIRPSIEAGKWVLCDRFFDSTRVYQGVGRGLGDTWLQMLYRHLFGSFAPDLTLWLDIEPKVGLARTQSRNGDEARFESLPIEFHEHVREGFAWLAKVEPQRIHRIDASASSEIVHQAIIETMNARFELALSPTKRQAA